MRQEPFRCCHSPILADCWSSSSSTSHIIVKCKIHAAADLEFFRTTREASEPRVIQAKRLERHVFATLIAAPKRRAPDRVDRRSGARFVWACILCAIPVRKLVQTKYGSDCDGQRIVR
jgi:hypothetical protein